MTGISNEVSANEETLLNQEKFKPQKMSQAKKTQSDLIEIRAVTEDTPVTIESTKGYEVPETDSQKSEISLSSHKSMSKSEPYETHSTLKIPSEKVEEHRAAVPDMSKEAKIGLDVQLRETMEASSKVAKLTNVSRASSSISGEKLSLEQELVTSNTALEDELESAPLEKQLAKVSKQFYKEKINVPSISVESETKELKATPILERKRKVQFENTEIVPSNEGQQKANISMEISTSLKRNSATESMIFEQVEPTKDEKPESQRGRVNFNYRKEALEANTQTFGIANSDSKLLKPKTEKAKKSRDASIPRTEAFQETLETVKSYCSPKEKEHIDNASFEEHSLPASDLTVPLDTLESLNMTQTQSVVRELASQSTVVLDSKLVEDVQLTDNLKKGNISPKELVQVAPTMSELEPIKQEEFRKPEHSKPLESTNRSLGLEKAHLKIVEESSTILKENQPDYETTDPKEEMVKALEQLTLSEIEANQPSEREIVTLSGKEKEIPAKNFMESKRGVRSRESSTARVQDSCPIAESIEKVEITKNEPQRANILKNINDPLIESSISHDHQLTKNISTEIVQDKGILGPSETNEPHICEDLLSCDQVAKTIVDTMEAQKASRSRETSLSRIGETLVGSETTGKIEVKKRSKSRRARSSKDTSLDRTQRESIEFESTEKLSKFEDKSVLPEFSEEPVSISQEATSKKIKAINLPSTKEEPVSESKCGDLVEVAAAKDVVKLKSIPKTSIEVAVSGFQGATNVLVASKMEKEAMNTKPSIELAQPLGKQEDLGLYNTELLEGNNEKVTHTANFDISTTEALSTVKSDQQGMLKTFEITQPEKANQDIISIQPLESDLNLTDEKYGTLKALVLDQAEKSATQPHGSFMALSNEETADFSTYSFVPPIPEKLKAVTENEKLLTLGEANQTESVVNEASEKKNYRAAHEIISEPQLVLVAEDPPIWQEGPEETSKESSTKNKQVHFAEPIQTAKLIQESKSKRSIKVKSNNAQEKTLNIAIEQETKMKSSENVSDGKAETSTEILEPISRNEPIELDSINKATGKSHEILNQASCSVEETSEHAHIDITPGNEVVGRTSLDNLAQRQKAKKSMTPQTSLNIADSASYGKLHRKEGLDYEVAHKTTEMNEEIVMDQTQDIDETRVLSPDHKQSRTIPTILTQSSEVGEASKVEEIAETRVSRTGEKAAFAQDKEEQVLTVNQTKTLGIPKEIIPPLKSSIKPSRIPNYEQQVQENQGSDSSQPFRVRYTYASELIS